MDKSQKGLKDYVVFSNVIIYDLMINPKRDWKYTIISNNSVFRFFIDKSQKGLKVLIVTLLIFITLLMINPKRDWKEKKKRKELKR